MYEHYLTTQLFSADFLSQSVILLCKQSLYTPRDHIILAYQKKIAL